MTEDYGNNTINTKGVQSAFPVLLTDATSVRRKQTEYMTIDLYGLDNKIKVIFQRATCI